MLYERMLVTFPSVVSLALVLSACNPTETSDSSSSSGGSAGSTTKVSDLNGQTGSASVSGKVADGYLAGATVCLDLDSSDTCDDGEPTATSTAGGNYTISNASNAQVRNGTILVVTTDETTDDDLPGEGKVGAGITLTAPPGKGEFVSPISTMIQTSLENDPTLTVDAATRSIATSLGLDDSEVNRLAQDYISSTDTAGKTVRRLGQLVTRIQSEARQKFNDEFKADSGLSDQKFSRLSRNVIQTYIDERIEMLREWSKSNPNAIDLEAVDTKASSVVSDIVSSGSAAETFKERAEYLEKTSSTTPVINAQNVIEAGVYDIDDIYLGQTGSTITYSTTAKSTANSVLTTRRIEVERDAGSSWAVGDRADTKSGNRVYINNDRSADEITFSNHGMGTYVVYGDSFSFAYDFHDNNEFTFTAKHYLDGQVVKEVSKRVSYSFRITDIAGRSVSWFLEEYLGEPNSGVSGTFPTGSEIIITTFSQGGGLQFEALGTDVLYSVDSENNLTPASLAELSTLSDLGGYVVKTTLNGVDYYVRAPDSIGGSSSFDVFTVSGSKLDKKVNTIAYELIELEDGRTAVKLATSDAKAINLETNLVSFAEAPDESDYPGGFPVGYSPVPRILTGSTVSYRNAIDSDRWAATLEPSLNETAYDALVRAMGIPVNLQL